MSSSSEEDESEPVAQELLLDELSADTLAALQSHLARADESSSSEDEDGGAGVSENFGLSQFWVRVNSFRRLALQCRFIVLSKVLTDVCRVSRGSMMARRRDGLQRKQSSTRKVARLPF